MGTHSHPQPCGQKRRTTQAHPNLDTVCFSAASAPGLLLCWGGFLFPYKGHHPPGSQVDQVFRGNKFSPLGYLGMMPVISTRFVFPKDSNDLPEHFDRRLWIWHGGPNPRLAVTSFGRLFEVQALGRPSAMQGIIPKRPGGKHRGLHGNTTVLNQTCKVPLCCASSQRSQQAQLLRRSLRFGGNSLNSEM
jgi:hypothetical protein